MGVVTRLQASVSRCHRLIAGKEDMLFSKRSRPALGPAEPPLRRYCDSSPVVKQPGRGAGHSPLF